MAKQADVLRVYPLEAGSGRYVCENLTTGSLHFPNVQQMTCDCRHAEVYPRNPKCYHLREACEVEARRLKLRAEMPIKAALATKEATGRDVLPEIPEMPREELVETWGTVSIAGWDEKTEDEQKAVFA